jgi:hypothetical protein
MTQSDLTPEQVRDAFNLGSYELVDELCKLAFKLLDAEEARLAKIDTKASGLLASAGISLSIVSSVGIGLVLPANSPVSGASLLVVALAVGVSCITGVVTAAYAANALGARRRAPELPSSRWGTRMAGVSSESCSRRAKVRACWVEPALVSWPAG